MADQDRERELEKLSLAKPSLLPRRKKKDPAPPAAPPPAPQAAAPAAAPVAPPAAQHDPPPAPVEPAPAPEPAATPRTAPTPPADPARPWWAGAAAAVRRPARAPSEDRPAPVAAEPLQPANAAVQPPVQPAEASREPRTPPLTGTRAVAAVGLVAGLLIVGLTTASLALCEAVRGTPSCGGAGYLFLIAIVVAVAMLGGLALAALQVSDPRGTSILAVGVVAVVVLLVLVPVIFSWTMVVVIPALTVLAFLGSHWLTTVTDDQTPAWEEPARDDTLQR